MKHTLIAFTIALSLILTPFQGIHAQATTANAELIQKLLAQIVILQAELQKLIAARGGDTTSTNTNTPKTITSDSTPCNFTRTLREGTQGTDVTCLQTYLKKKGHFSGTATGYYGPQTKDAVYKWQKSVGIVPEPTAIGMFGPRSQETLVREMKTTAPVATTNTQNTTNTTPRTTNGGGGGGSTPRNTTDTPRTTPRTTTPTVTTPRTTATTTVPKTTTATSTMPVATVPKGNATIPSASGNSTSWNTLCAQSGIFVCDDFSDPTKLKGRLIKGFVAPVVRNGLLELTIPTKSPANAGGNYTVDFPAVGAGKFLAFSYRIKADEVATNLDAPGRKEFTIWRGSSPCTDFEMTQTHKGYGNPIIVTYTECGSGHFSYSTSTTNNLQLHYPDYSCTYQNQKKRPIGEYCAFTHANQWENYYIEMQIGTLGQPNSRVTLWKKIDGGVWKRYIDTSTFTFKGTGGLEHLMLTVYMTGKDATVDHPEGKVWFDHLIMSTKPFNVDQFLGSASAPSVPASVPAPATTTAPQSPVVPPLAPAPPKPVVVPADLAKTVLGQVASALQPGQYTKMPENLSLKYLPMHYSLFYYGDSATWDPIHKEIVWTAGPGTCCAKPATYQRVNYNLATDAWTLTPTEWSVPGHGYDGNALNTRTGEHYFLVPATDIFVDENGVWKPFPKKLPQTPVIASALEWFPDLYNGNGGLVYVSGGGKIQVYDGSAWVSFPKVANPWINYDVVAQYNPVYKVVLIAGGTKMYRLDKDLNMVQLKDAPFSMQTSPVNLTVDPQSGKYLVTRHSDRTWWEYDIVTDTWTQIFSLTNAPMPKASYGAYHVPIPELGVIVYITHYAEKREVWVFKYGSNPREVPTPTVTGIPPVTDTAAPVVTIPNPTQSLPAGTNSTVLTVTTNESATCRRNANSRLAFVSYEDVFQTTDGLSHTFSLQELADGSTATHYIRCADKAWNVSSFSPIVITVASSSPTVLRPTQVPLTSSQTRLDILQDLLNQLKALQIELNKLKD